MHDDTWWDGDDEGDAIAQLQRVLAPLREAPRPWGDVIAQARFVAPTRTSRRSSIAAATIGIAAALVLGWQLSRREPVSDANAELHVNVQPPVPVAQPVVVIGPAVDPSQALARSLKIVDEIVRLDAVLKENARLAAERELERKNERNKTPRRGLSVEELSRLSADIDRGKGLLPSPVQDDELPETLSTDDIRVAMNRVKPAAKACGKQHGAAKGEMVKIKLTIDGTTGRPTTVNAQGHAGTALGECIVEVVRTAQFPRFRKPSLGVVYPFRF